MNAKELLESKNIKDTLFDEKTNTWVKGGLSALMEEYSNSRLQIKGGDVRQWLIEEDFELLSKKW